MKIWKKLKEDACTKFAEMSELTTPTRRRQAGKQARDFLETGLLLWDRKREKWRAKERADTQASKRGNPLAPRDFVGGGQEKGLKGFLEMDIRTPQTRTLVGRSTDRSLTHSLTLVL